MVLVRSNCKVVMQGKPPISAGTDRQAYNYDVSYALLGNSANIDMSPRRSY